MNITFALIVSVLTIIVGVLVKVIGFPSQFMKNYNRKSTRGLSSTFIFLAFISYVLWTLHGIFQKDLTLIIGQGIGILTTGAIVLQIIYYRK